MCISSKAFTFTCYHVVLRGLYEKTFIALLSFLPYAGLFLQTSSMKSVGALNRQKYPRFTCVMSLPELVRSVETVVTAKSVSCKDKEACFCLLK